MKIMEYMDKLRDKLCDELDEIARKPEMSAGDLETAHKLTDKDRHAGRGWRLFPGR